LDADERPKRYVSTSSYLACVHSDAFRGVAWGRESLLATEILIA
jgi:hypothetical protein